MNLLKMFNIFIYKISDVDTNHVNLPLEKLQLALVSRTKTLEFLSGQCKSMLDVSNYRNSHRPSQYKRISQKRKLLCSDYRNYVYIKTTHHPIKFNSSIVKVRKREKLKLFVQESLQWSSPLPLPPALLNSYWVCLEI